MKRLIRKAEHDIVNRDSALLLINGKIYEDATHAACLQDFFKENGLENQYPTDFLTRPDFEQFEELSTEYKEIVLAHLVKNEDGVFILYGFINGTMVEYDGIPENIKQMFADKYNLPVYNDLEHESNGENTYDEEENFKNARNRAQQLNGGEEIEGELKNLGFEMINGFYSNGYINLTVDGRYIKVISIVGGPKREYTIEELINNQNTILNNGKQFLDLATKYNGTIEPKDENSFLFKAINSKFNIPITVYFKNGEGKLTNLEEAKKSNFAGYMDFKDYIEDENITTTDIEYIEDLKAILE